MTDSVACMAETPHLGSVAGPFWGAKGAPILFSEIGFCVASCSYICIYLSRWRRRGVL